MCPHSNNTHYSTGNKSVDFISTDRVFPSRLLIAQGLLDVLKFPGALPALALPSPLQTGLAPPFFLTYSQKRRQDAGSPGFRRLQSQWLPGTCPLSQRPSKGDKATQTEGRSGLLRASSGQLLTHMRGKEARQETRQKRGTDLIVRGAAGPRPTAHFLVLSCVCSMASPGDP